LADERAGRPVATTMGGAFVVGWASLSAVFIALGFFLTKFALAGRRGAWDEHVNRWLADNRTAWLNDVTSAATFIANTFPVVIIAAVLGLALLALRRWREAILLAWALATELTVFLTANYIVDRPRPNVPRLDSTPSTGSFPSGHIAATLVLWVGLVLVVTALTANLVARAIAWVVAVVLPAMVGFARVYRGMHHVTDVLAGALLGIGALVVAVMAIRLLTALIESRARRRARSTTSAVSAGHS